LIFIQYKIVKMSDKLKIRVPNFNPSEKLHLMRLIANKFYTHKTLVGLPSQFDDDADESPIIVQDIESNNEVEFIIENEFIEKVERDNMDIEHIQSHLVS